MTQEQRNEPEPFFIFEGYREEIEGLVALFYSLCGLAAPGPAAATARCGVFVRAAGGVERVGLAGGWRDERQGTAGGSW